MLSCLLGGASALIYLLLIRKNKKPNVKGFGRKETFAPKLNDEVLSSEQQSGIDHQRAKDSFVQH